MPPTPETLLILVAIGAFTAALMMLYALFGEQRAASDTVEGATEAPQVQLVRPPDAEETLLDRVGALASPQKREELDALQKLLIQAGLRGPRDMDAFLLSRTLLALLVPILVQLFMQPEGLAKNAFYLLLGASAGYYIPWLYLMNARARRRHALMESFPDALDMLVSCLEAGQGLDAALHRVAREIRATSPVLADELDITNNQTSAGIARGEALHDLDLRTGLSEINSLVNVLAHAEKYGAGIAESIRAHAHLVRRRRALAAEERAARATPKLTVVMILFILPAMFVVVLGPAIVNIMQRLLPTIGGMSQ